MPPGGFRPVWGSLRAASIRTGSVFLSACCTTCFYDGLGAATGGEAPARAYNRCPAGIVASARPAGAQASPRKRRMNLPIVNQPGEVGVLLEDLPAAVAPTPPLPMSRAEMEARGWDSVDV